VTVDLPRTAEDNEEEPPAPRPREAPTATRLRRWSEAGLLLIGAFGLVIFGYCSLGLEFALPNVDPRKGSLRPTDAWGWTGQWFLVVVITAVTLLLVSGLPFGSLRSGRGSLRGAIAQGLGGAVVGCWTFAVGELTKSLYFTGSNDECTYLGCWPVDQEKWAFVVPGLLTAVVMIVMALLVTRLAWWIRALVPVVVWIGGVVAQYWIWMTYLLPIFEGPPR
jgi:hypothetical protein